MRKTAGIPLRWGWPDGEHEIRVVKQTEAGYGRAAVEEIRVTGSAAPQPTAAKAPPHRVYRGFHHLRLRQYLLERKPRFRYP